MASSTGWRRLVVSITLLGISSPAAVQDATSRTPRPARELPNIVLTFTDDQGYADVGCFGAKGFATPHLDRLAAEGVRLTNFHVAQAVCSASRAALLTGCYPNRIGIHGALGPNARHGIHDAEMTLAELVKQKGYATAIFGKWHLGHRPQFLPTRHGFDEYFGLPYSNDMWPWHPGAGASYPPLPLIEGDKVVEHNPDQRKLTGWYTERAVQFVERAAAAGRERPFFLYLAHSMPHVPLFVSKELEGKSAGGLYADVIEEIDASVGRVLDALERAGVARDTLVIFATDNGPWLSYGEHAGSAHPLREGKGTAWEGGVRTPCIARWPGRIPAGSVCREPLMSIDLFPTIAGLIGAELPAHGVDGRDVWPLLSGAPGAKCPHEAYFFYFAQNELQAVLSSRWKLYLPHTYRTLAGRPGGRNGRPTGYREARVVAPELYDLESDVSETKDVAAAHPEVVERLLAFAERCRDDLGDALTNRKGKNVREPGKLAAAER